MSLSEKFLLGVFGVATIGALSIGVGRAINPDFLYFGTKYQRVPPSVEVGEGFTDVYRGQLVKCTNPGIQDEEFGGFRYNPERDCKPYE